MTTPSSTTPFEVSTDVYGLPLGPDDTLGVFLVVDDEPTLVDAATAASVETIVAGMEDLGVAPETLANVVVSHVHLDHSGAAAGLADRSADLDVYIHESTAHHLVDPGRLVESTRQVLGEAFERMGAPDPLAEDRLVRVPDEGVSIDTGAHTLEVLHTPGHSPDHLSVWDAASGVAFANEAIGRYYPKADCWVPPVTLPNFDAGAVARSTAELRALGADDVALSHVGTLPAADAFDRAAARLEEFTRRIPAWYGETGDLEGTVERVRERLLTLDGDYPDRVAAQQAAICTRGVLDDRGLL